MKKLVTAMAAGGLLFTVSASVLADGSSGPLDPKNFSATATFTTDYVFRGISNTTNGPAMQGSFDWAYKGFNLGIWGSNTDFGVNESLELDGYGGYSWSWMGLDLNISGLYYSYPGNGGYVSPIDGHTVVDPGYGEAHFGVAHTFANVTFSPTVGADYYYSPSFYGQDGEGHYVDGTLSLALPQDFALNGTVGWQTVAGDKSTTGFDYGNWLIGVSKSLAGFNFDLNYQDTWHNQGVCGPGVDICDSRVVFSISRSM